MVLGAEDRTPIVRILSEMACGVACGVVASCMGRNLSISLYFRRLNCGVGGFFCALPPHDLLNAFNVATGRAAFKPCACPSVLCNSIIRPMVLSLLVFCQTILAVFPAWTGYHNSGIDQGEKRLTQVALFHIRQTALDLNAF